MWFLLSSVLTQLCIYQGCQQCQLCLSCSIAPQGYLLTSLGCRSCLYSCATCSSETSCITCNSWFYQSGSQCFACDFNCIQCSISSGKLECSSCGPGYYLRDGQCLPCLYPNSKTCEFNLVVSCNPGFYVFNGGQCLPCTIKNCNSCTSTTCNSCLDKFFLVVSSNSCNQCNPLCLSCSSLTRCNSCIQGASRINNVCINCQSIASNCVQCSLTACISCSSSFRLQGANCISFSQPDQNCLTMGALSCSKCKAGYLLVSSFCVPCSVLCQTCSSPNFGQCQKCSSKGLSLSQSPSKCIPLVQNPNKLLRRFFITARNDPSAFSNYQLDYCLQSAVLSSNNQMSIAVSKPQGYALRLYIKLYIPDSASTNLQFQWKVNSQNPEVQQESFVAQALGNICKGQSDDYFEIKSFYFAKVGQQNTLTIQASSPFMVSQILIQSSLCYSSACAVCSSLSSCLKCQLPSMLIQQGDCVNECSQSFFFLQADSKCYRACPLGYFQQWVDRSCQSCGARCQSCSIATRCMTCLKQYFFLIDTGECLQACPQTFYKFQGLCVKCKSPCKSCLGQNSCLTCLIGLLLNQACKNQCPSTHYPDYASLSCVVCDPTEFCSTCLTREVCLTCVQGYFLTQKESRCQQLCPAGFYGSLGLCVLCSPQCFTCDNSGCLYCSIGFLLGNACVFQCPSTKYGETATMSCESCQSHCTSCRLQPNICLSCAPGFVLDVSSCVSSCLPGMYISEGRCLNCLRPCLTCNAVKSCSSCIASFLKGNECVSIFECGNNLFADLSTMTCAQCSAQCLTCYGKSERCLICSQGFSYFERTCLQTCPNYSTSYQGVCVICNQPCLSCLMSQGQQFCTQCTQSYLTFRINSNIVNCILVCPQTYFNQRQLCISCSPKCQYCQDLTLCYLCQQAFLWINQKGDSLCVNDCSAVSSYSQFNSLSGSCRACQLPCKTCQSLQICISCQSNLFLYGTLCLTQCPFGFFGDSSRMACERCVGCRSCSSALNCLSCLNDFYLSRGSCRSSCPDRYFANRVLQRCEPCRQPCNTCQGADSYCTSCISNTNLQNNMCLSQCSQSYFFDGNVCRKCIEGCLRCSNQLACQVCVKGLNLYQGSCRLSCPQRFYGQSGKCLSCQSPCLSCQSLYECLQCLTGYLLQTSCLQFCPVNYYRDQQQKACLRCVKPCASCNSKSYCLSCIQGIALGGRCLELCPPGFYKMNSNFCNTCKGYCKTCRNQLSCFSCKSGFLFKDSCLLNCPSGTMGVEGLCQTCLSPCLTCQIQTNICLICENGYLKFGSSCLKECPVNSFQSRGQCRLCQFPCKTCKSATQCSSCAQGFLHLEGQFSSECLNSTKCPNGLYVQVQTLKCVRECRQSFAIDQYAKTCSQTCRLPLVQHNGLCVFDCPSPLVISPAFTCESHKPGASLLTALPSAVMLKNRVYVFLNFSQEIVWLMNPTRENLLVSRSSSGRIMQQSQLQVESISYDLRSVAFLLAQFQSPDIDVDLVLINSSTLLRGFSTQILQNRTFRLGFPKSIKYTQAMWLQSQWFSQWGMAATLVTGTFVTGMFLMGKLALCLVVIRPLQLFYLLAFLKISYPPNLQQFLLSFQAMHCNFFPNVLSAFVLKERAASPENFYSNSWDVSFARNVGGQLLIVLVIVVLTIVSKILNLICRAGQWERLEEYSRLMSYRMVYTHLKDCLIITLYSQLLFGIASIYYLPYQQSLPFVLPSWLCLLLLFLWTLHILHSKPLSRRGLLDNFYHLLSGRMQRWHWISSICRMLVQGLVIGLAGEYPLYVLPVLSFLSIVSAISILSTGYYLLRTIDVAASVLEFMSLIFYSLLAAFAYRPAFLDSNSWQFGTATSLVGLFLSVIVAVLAGMLTFVPQLIVIEEAEIAERNQKLKLLKKLQQQRKGALFYEEKSVQHQKQAQAGLPEQRKIIFRLQDGKVTFKQVMPQV